MASSAQRTMTTVEDFLKQVGPIKTAADPKSEPGSIGGATTHPVKNVDDNLHAAPEGARTKENEKDVKEDQGAASVDSTPEKKKASDIFAAIGQFAKASETMSAPSGTAADDQVQIGTNKQPTGEDPANSTSSAKGGKEDKKNGNMGGTTHPASTENESLGGGKYAFDKLVDQPLEKLAGLMQELGNGIAAEFAWLGSEPKTAAAEPAKTVPAGTTTPATKTAGIDAELARQLGWEMAGLVTGNFDKQAADSLVQQALEDIVKQASDDADAFIEYAQGYAKQAAEMPPEGEPPPGSGGGGGEGEGEGGAGGGEAAMMSALGGGAPAGGMPPGAGAGASPADAGAGGAGGNPQVQEILQLCEQLQVSPEELLAALQQEHSGGGAEAGGMGGPPPGAMGAMGAMGGPPPGGPPAGGGAAPPPGMQVAAADKAAIYKQTKDILTEIITRSRKR